MKLPARILKTVATGRDGSRVQIEITDTTSGVLAAAFEISLADFGKLVAMPTDVEVEVEWRVQHLGWRHETKTEVVCVRRNSVALDRAERAAAVVAALAPFEVDGWVGQRSDLFNVHKRVEPVGPSTARRTAWTGDAAAAQIPDEHVGYRVTFSRMVKPWSP